MARRGLRRSLGALLALPLLLAGSGLAQSKPQPATRPVEPGDQAVELSSNLVTVTLVVRNAAGALVGDLKPEEFAVYEDDAPQEIDRFFRQQEVPLRLALLFDTSFSVAKRLDF